MSAPYNFADHQIDGFLYRHQASKGHSGGPHIWQTQDSYSVPRGFDETPATMDPGVRKSSKRSSHHKSHASSSRNTGRSSTSSRTVSTALTVPSTATLPPSLVCEFVGYSGCNQMFDINDVENWINHMASYHLGNRFPMDGICWFCNIRFEARSPADEDRWACYRERMLHVAGHFRAGSTYGQMRPDHDFLDHIHDNGIIDSHTFEMAAAYHEAPQTEYLYPAGSRPRRRERSAYEERQPPRERYRRRADGSMVYI